MDPLTEHFLQRLSVERHYSEHTLRAYRKDLELFEEFLRGRGRGISEATVRDVTREHKDQVFRRDHERMVIVFADTEREGAQAIGRRIRDAVDARYGSMGIAAETRAAIYPEDGESASELLAATEGCPVA